MKTNISIPDEVFEAAERMAQTLGLSRSQLYARAVSEFVARQRASDVTARLDGVYGENETASRLDPTLTAIQSLSLAPEDRRETRRDLAGGPAAADPSCQRPSRLR